MLGVKFNPEINLGTLIEMATFIVVVAGVFTKFGRLETKLNIMFDWFQRTVIGHSISGGTPPTDEEIRRFHGKE